MLLLHCTLQIKGGADAHVHLLEKELPRFGVDTAFIAISGESPLEINLESLDKKINGKYDNIVSAAGCILEYCKKEEVTVIHVHSTLHPAIIKILARNYRIIRTLHNAALTCVSGEKYFVTDNTPCNCKFGIGCLARAYTKKCASTRQPLLLMRRYYKVANEKKWSQDIYSSIISPSNFVYSLCVKEGIRVSKMKRIPYPYAGNIRQAEERRSGGTFNILFSGRITMVKGVMYLPEIAFPVLSRFPHAILHIAGEGPMKEKLRELVPDAIKDQVIFHGWLNQNEVQQLYEKADVFLIPSIYPDNFPITCLEALHYGKTVLVFDVGGLAEMVENGVNGFVFERGNGAGMKEQLTRLALDPEWNKKLGQEGRRIFNENYTLGKVIPQIIESYQS